MMIRQLTACSLLAACASTGDPGRPHASAAVLSSPVSIYVASADAERPRLRYSDGQLSGNATCFIRIGNKLNNKVPPLYINGAPIGFC
ncbi:MAG: hypothetical protein ACI8QZ_003706 [Chlamydiales bacterium]|jgi:hypothetical protein